jgi:glycosyltransferase involved in cell wall biosynthesis
MEEDLIVRVLRIYHAGGSHASQARERALAAVGIDVTLVVPSQWPEDDVESTVTDENVPIVELPVRRPRDVNRHSYADTDAVARLLREQAPDVIDVHEEPFSVAAKQWLAASPRDLPVVMYTAQNIDKRLPPPFARYERAAHRRAAALYPCSRQAASVARGKGFAGLIDVLPLGYDDTEFFPGTQSLDDEELVLGLVGRLVAEKGIVDAVEILERVNRARPARLIVVGGGPAASVARARAVALGLMDRVEFHPWLPASELANIYRTMHVALVPSRPTTTWVEQFGRVIVEAQASGAVVAGYSSGSIPEVAGESAIIAQVGAFADLAHCIAEVMSDAADYDTRRTQGVERSRARTWTRVAERQADLYRRVASGDVSRLELPSSPRTRRELARAEFGPTAPTTAGARPFALPLLRRGGRLPDALAWLLDLSAELASRVRAARHSQVDSTSR